MSEPSDAVRQRAGDRCEYCHLPQLAFRRAFHVEHIVARQHGGLTRLDNLAFACWNCNLKKGPNLSGVDPQTGQITALFHPRKGEWEEHFCPVIGALFPLGVAIRGLTPVGRATVEVLGLNEEMRQMLRYEFWLEGLYTAAVPPGS
jgi:hypothetical protein